MADIAMCMNKDCPSTALCHRATAVPNDRRQSYQTYHVTGGALMCDSFMCNEDRVKYDPSKEAHV